MTDEEAAFLCEASVYLIDQCIALREMAQARVLIRRSLDAVGKSEGAARSMIVGALGAYLVKAGDRDGGLKLIEQAREAAMSIAEPRSRDFALSKLAESLFKAGSCDESLALFKALTAETREHALTGLIDILAVDTHRVGWFGFATVNIKIGQPYLDPKDPSKTRELLPRLADAVRASGDAKVQARTLATISHLQARAGDFSGAIATAESIPELRRSDFPGPSDGFYEAVKPVAFALVAGVMDEKNEHPAAATSFARAEAYARSVKPADQRLIAEIAIAELEVSSRHDAATAVAKEALPLALAQPEPRRSRTLTMLAAVQIKAGDLPAAARIIDAIRERPGLERAHALAVLARHHDEVGDDAAALSVRRKAIALLEAYEPVVPPPGQGMTSFAFSRDTFIDYDQELAPALVKSDRDGRLRDLRARSSSIVDMVREAKSLPSKRSGFTLTSTASAMAYQGHIDAALDVASAIEEPGARMGAYAGVTSAITVLRKQASAR